VNDVLISSIGFAVIAFGIAFVAYKVWRKSKSQRAEIADAVKSTSAAAEAVTEKLAGTIKTTTQSYIKRK
jgi:hypothetical protein